MHFYEFTQTVKFYTSTTLCMIQAVLPVSVQHLNVQSWDTERNSESPFWRTTPQTAALWPWKVLKCCTCIGWNTRTSRLRTIRSVVACGRLDKPAVVSRAARCRHQTPSPPSFLQGPLLWCHLSNTIKTHINMPLRHFPTWTGSIFLVLWFTCGW